MSIVQLDRGPDGAVRFLAQAGLMSGRWFRVYDVRIVAERLRVVDVGSSEATHRSFVQADRGRWTYKFVVTDSRTLEPAALERQLQSAKYRMPDAVRRGE